MEAVAPQRRLAGRYVLQELIATGGMAEVWRARDEVLARTVAVKVLRPDLADDAELSERFQREAVAAARLSHPHIVSVFDTGTDDGTRYIVMEDFGGRSLRDLAAQRRPLAPQEALAITLPVLEALGYAHSEGLIHRDIKPGNILVDEAMGVKVTDFGIAKAAYARGDLTTTGSMLGTVRYVSPEQVEGGEIDGRSDLYSTGVVLYELLTGRPPFEGETDVATALMRLTTHPLPPRAIRSGIPRRLESVVMRALARRPDDRFPSAGAMRAALDRHAAPTEAHVTQALPAMPAGEQGGPRRGSALRSWMLVPLVLILLAGAAVGVGVAVGRLEIGGPLGVRAAPKAESNDSSNPSRIQIQSAKDFDPQGSDGTENPNDAALATDGDPSTAWRTDHYSSAGFGNLKDGVGLWLDLGKSAEVERVVIRTSLPGWSFQIKAGQLGRPSDPLASTDGETTFTAANGRTVIPLERVQSSGLLIWITSLAPDGGRFAAAITEVSVQGPS